MSNQRIIKKYPNRRLYDTEISRYITLGDVKKLVLNNVDFVVKDVKSNEDLTRIVLMQIIAEQENGDNPLFSAKTLLKLVHSYNTPKHYFLSGYLEKCLDTFTQQQEAFHNKLQRDLADGISESEQILSESEIELWNELQENFFNAASELSLQKPKTDN